MQEEKCRSWFCRQGQKAFRNWTQHSRLAEAEPLACAACPIPLLPHSPTPPHPPRPSTLHIVPSPVSLSVINYERHKPPGLMLCRGCLPKRAKRLPSLITPGTLSGSPIYWQAKKKKSTRRALHRPRKHQHFLVPTFIQLQRSVSSMLASL